MTETEYKSIKRGSFVVFGGGSPRKVLERDGNFVTLERKIAWEVDRKRNYVIYTKYFLKSRGKII